MRRLVSTLLLVNLLGQTGALLELREALDAARAHYDVAAAEAIWETLRAPDPAKTGGDSTRLRAEAALLIAELHRIDWERLPESDIAERRPLGNQIDEAAQDGLDALANVAQDSDYYRLKADLLAVMIRSDFRAKKYRKEMEEAAAKAIELDPNNAKAYVSRAKPFVFARANEGGDPRKAIELLTRSLDVDPNLETARCLRGLAYKLAGEPERAREDWETALKRNPSCRPARDELQHLRVK
jgi:tetratricopeptide (TPR) repeat protein